MNGNLLVLIIIATISALIVLIAGLLAASVLRRVYQGRKYRRQDALQALYREKLALALGDAAGIADRRAFSTVPGSAAWRALENVFFEFMDEHRNQAEIQRLFSELGYTTYYENRLANKNVLIRSSAADKLGRMRSESSTGKLLPLLDETDPEVLSVAVRALSKIGSEEGLRGIIDRMPSLLGKSLVTRKAMEMSLLNFGPAAIPFLVGYQGENADPWIVSCILETLSHLPVDDRSVSLAAARLQSPNAEVRSKALKVLERAGGGLPAHLAERIPPLLGDPLWFVRLQAIRTLKATGGEAAAVRIEKSLFDENWQVRNEAALTLSRLGAIDVFLDALATGDAYAKESICEEIEKTDFAALLIKNLAAPDDVLREKSRKILKVMHGLRYSTPLHEYLAKGEDEGIKRELGRFMTEKAES